MSQTRSLAGVPCLVIFMASPNFKQLRIRQDRFQQQIGQLL
jgi:hypothetical protein